MPYAFLSFMFLTATASGQSVASLTGVVTDTYGGVISGVSVVVRDVDTGVENRVTSSSSGSYTFPSLQIGTYVITAEDRAFPAF